MAVPVFGRTRELGVAVRPTCLLVSTKRDLNGSQGPVGQVGGPRIWAWVPVGQRGSTSTQGIRECACARDSGEGGGGLGGVCVCVCAFALVTFDPDQPTES